LILSSGTPLYWFTDFTIKWDFSRIFSIYQKSFREVIIEMGGGRGRYDGLRNSLSIKFVAGDTGVSSHSLGTWLHHHWLMTLPFVEHFSK
jgi:hypothetical protein